MNVAFCIVGGLFAVLFLVYVGLGLKGLNLQFKAPPRRPRLVQRKMLTGCIRVGRR